MKFLFDSFIVPIGFFFISIISGLAYGEDAPIAETPEGCITVEFLMYSGMARPKYLICEKLQKEAALKKLLESNKVKPADLPIKDLESTPSYQGILITSPIAGNKSSNRIVIRSGFVIKSGRVLLDNDRTLEHYFLELGKGKKDISNPKNPSPMNELVTAILAEISEH